MSFQDLVNKEKIEKIDFLQIDAEGYDFEILKTVNLDKFKPKIINLESTHFSDKTRELYENLLGENGYKFFRDKVDTCAYKIN